MALARVKPDDLDQVAAVVHVLNAARRVDDPESWPDLVELMAGELAYGWDLEPPEQFLYTPDGAEFPVASLSVKRGPSCFAGSLLHRVPIQAFSQRYPC